MNVTGDRGFTLIEALLSIAILTILTGLTLTIGRTTLLRNDLSSATDLLVSSIRRSQSLAQSNATDSRWGVHLEQSKIVLFRGNSYATRDATYDEISKIAGGVGVGGSAEVVFSQVVGLPVSTATFTFSNILGDVTNISVNGEGVVLY